MIDHFQEEKIITGYNPGVARRLLRYAIPFRYRLMTAGLCLLLATVGEMLIPVVIQRTIDHEVLDYWVSISLDARDQLDIREGMRTAEENTYIRQHEMDRFPRATREELRRQGDLSVAEFLVIRRSLLEEEHPEVFREVAGFLVDSGDQWLVFPRAMLDDLSREQRRVLRSDNVAGLTRNVFLFLGVLVGVLLGGFGQIYLTASVGQDVMKRLRLELFEHTMRQHLGYLGNQPVGRLVTRVTNDVETINELFTSVLAELARNASLMVAVIITMYALNPRLATIVIISMVPVILLTDIVRKKAREAYRAVRRAVSSVNAYLSEYISGMVVVQMFVQQHKSRRDFTGRNRELLEATLKEMRVFAVFRPIVDFLASVSTAVVIYSGAFLIGIDLVSLGVLIAFINLIRRFYMPVMSISEQFTVLQSAMAGSERVFELLDHDQRIPDTGVRTTTDHPLHGSIEFRQVEFSYKPLEPVLRDVSFRAKPGEMVALVGYTGSGKTTVINLLTRLWDVQKGEILLDGRNLRDYRISDLRRGVQQIQQDVFLFEDTIRNNITLGLEVSDKRIWDACEAVQAAPFIRDLPEGIHTPVSERGGNLSTGQRQLLAFARVLLHDPPVLVLDEATSSIDSETERHLQHAVETVTRGRTSLVIAHRLSTIKHAERILVLSHGKLVESGTHRELLESGGLYATLYHLQYEQQQSTDQPQDIPRD